MNLCGSKSVIESQKRADAWERIWRSDDCNGLSKYRRWSERLRENTGKSVDLLTHRLERIEFLNDHRDELLLRCAQSRRQLEWFLCRTWLVEGDVASFQPVAAAKAEGRRGTRWDNPSCRCLQRSSMA